jgi:hypothetical protein
MEPSSLTSCADIDNNKNYVGTMYGSVLLGTKMFIYPKANRTSLRPASLTWYLKCLAMFESCLLEFAPADFSATMRSA